MREPGLGRRHGHVLGPGFGLRHGLGHIQQNDEHILNKIIIYNTIYNIFMNYYRYPLSYPN